MIAIMLNCQLHSILTRIDWFSIKFHCIAWMDAVCFVTRYNPYTASIIV